MAGRYPPYLRYAMAGLWRKRVLSSAPADGGRIRSLVVT